MSTDRSIRAASGATSVAAPAPVSVERLAAVPGVLGRISRERAGDYAAGEPAGDRGTTAAAAMPPHDRSVSSTSDEASPIAPPHGAFEAALRTVVPAGPGATGLAVIAEVKRASPSQGQIAPLDPVAAAIAYEAGGAAALSVLTEPRHFGGDIEHLRRVAATLDRAGTPLPLLRKDFTVHPDQLVEAKEAGAAAVLLIVAVLGDATREYLRFATALGLDTLVEVHDDTELDVALAAGARIIGVNNRDLRTLAIDLATAPTLLARARGEGFDGVLVAESGYRTPSDLATVEGSADAVLVGTSLAGSGDLTRALRVLRGDPTVRPGHIR